MSAGTRGPEALPTIGGSLYLVGMMGAGKSSVGRQLAKHLRKSFYDSDHEIERRTGVRIPLIFEIEGEAGFRRREAEVLAELARLPDIVLATGGGVVLDPGNRRCLAESGTVIYLRASPRELWHRTRHDRNRPLLRTADPLARLEELTRQRDPLYTEIADLIVDTGSQTVRTLVLRLEKELRRQQRMAPGPGAASSLPASGGVGA